MHFEAVIVDSSLGMVIAGVSDMTRGETKIVTMADGRKRIMESGPQNSSRRLSSSVPTAKSSPKATCPWAEAASAGTRDDANDLKLDGDKETFTIKVIYDTHELYGKVEASRQFSVCRN